MRMFILFLLTLTACGSGSNQELDYTKITQSDFKRTREPVLEEHLKRFEVLTGKSTNKLSTKFRSLDELFVGRCLVWTNGERTIEVDPDFWQNSSDSSRENLIFHEAGHCVLNLDHDSEMIQRNTLIIPRSLMYPYVLDGFYEKNVEYYHEELKTHVRP